MVFVQSKLNGEKELVSLSEQILATKSTCLLHEFKSVLEKECLGETTMTTTLKHRNTVIECLKKLSHLVPSKLLVNVLKRAIEINDTEFCCSYVKHIQALDESQAVDCIKFFLKDENQKQNIELESVANYDQKLDMLFGKKYDYRLLSTELKRLSSNEFLICANYLHSYLKNLLQMKQNMDDMDQVDTPPAAAGAKPTIIQITDLLCSFVDAHFTHITLTPKAQEIIADILSLIETQLDLFVDLISIESLLKEVQKNKALPLPDNHNQNMRHYYIEVLKLV